MRERERRGGGLKDVCKPDRAKRIHTPDTTEDILRIHGIGYCVKIGTVRHISTLVAVITHLIPLHYGPNNSHFLYFRSLSFTSFSILFNQTLPPHLSMHRSLLFKKKNLSTHILSLHSLHYQHTSFLKIKSKPICN